MLGQHASAQPGSTNAALLAAYYNVISWDVFRSFFFWRHPQNDLILASGQSDTLDAADSLRESTLDAADSLRERSRIVMADGSRCNQAALLFESRV